MEWDQFIIVRAHRSILSTALLLPLLPPSSSAIIAPLTYYMEASIDRWKSLGTLQIARQKTVLEFACSTSPFRNCCRLYLPCF